MLGIRFSFNIVMCLVFSCGIFSTVHINAAQQNPKKGKITEEQLWDEMLCGNEENVILYLQQGGNPNARKFGDTVFLRVAQFGPVPVFRALIEGGAKIDDKDQNNRTAFQYFMWEIFGLGRPIISREAYVPKIQLLLEAGEDPESILIAQYTALFLAAAARSLPLVRLFLDHRADIHRKTELGSVLHVAVAYANDNNDNFDVIQELVQRDSDGSNLFEQDRNKRTPLDLARGKNLKRIIAYLEQATLAAQKLKKEDPQARVLATRAGMSEISLPDIEMMAEQYVTGVTGHGKEKEMHTNLVKKLILDRNIGEIQKIFARRADGSPSGYLETPDELGYTPLLFAIVANRPTVVSALLELGANLNAQILPKHIGATPATAYDLAADKIIIRKILQDYRLKTGVKKE